MNKVEIDSVLRLFNGVIIEDTGCVERDTDDYISLGLKFGLILPKGINGQQYVAAKTIYGIDPQSVNSTFHKSFKTVINTDLEILIEQQLLHYITTYGYEKLGIYSNDSVFIPKEELEIPELINDIELHRINKMNSVEVKNAILQLINSGIALSENDITDILNLSNYIDKVDINNIQNREIKTALYDKLEIIPENNIEFLQYLVYKAIGVTMIVKNKETISMLKNSDRDMVYNYINNYISKFGYIKLAEIFLRYKNIFLAFKCSDDYSTYKNSKSLNKIINRISKLAKIYHKPLKPNILDGLTKISTKTELEANITDIKEKLNNITIFRQIRIINGLRYRQYINKYTDRKDIVYKIRNGKAYATTISNSNVSNKYIETQLELIKLITKDLGIKLKTRIENKTFYIPENIKYMAPTSAKQFMGNIPEGSYINIPRTKNMIYGVHWYDVDGERVDLDLKVLNDDIEIGWNAGYLTEDKEIVFSGDVTSAPTPLGATEVFLFGKKCVNGNYLIKLNNYTRNKKAIPFDILIGTLESEEYLERNYVVNPNSLITKINSTINNNTNSEYTYSNLTLGVVDVTDSEFKIHFTKYSDENSRISSRNEINSTILNYNSIYNKVQLTLDDLIKLGGGIITSENMTEEFEEILVNGEKLYRKCDKPVDFNLDLNVISKESLIKLLS